jgi:hypothetical protein
MYLGEFPSAGEAARAPEPRFWSADGLARLRARDERWMKRSRVTQKFRVEQK